MPLGRRSIRLPHYDYRQAGAYFVTLCVLNRECLLGDIASNRLCRSELGEIVAHDWEWLGQQYPYVKLDTWVLMPNHLHGIIFITDNTRRGGSRTAPTVGADSRKPLGRLIGAFKTVSTKHINLHRNVPGALFWQRNYYEHVVRNEQDLARIRDYIAFNPLRWAEDDNHPARFQ